VLHVFQVPGLAGAGALKAQAFFGGRPELMIRQRTGVVVDLYFCPALRLATVARASERKPSFSGRFIKAESPTV
jgi:hypothetical protein